MRKLLICLLIVVIAGCGTTSKLSAQKEVIKFTYNNDVSFEFSIPSNSIDINPSHIMSGTNFNDKDLKKNTQSVLWLLNRTYEQVRSRTYSGKYSIGLAAFSVEMDDNVHLKTINDLEALEKKYYKDEFDLDVDFTIRNISGHPWLWSENKSESISQHVSSAYSVLNEYVYIVFTFEYLGANKEELLAMRNVAEDTLISFSLQNNKVNKNVNINSAKKKPLELH